MRLPLLATLLCLALPAQAETPVQTAALSARLYAAGMAAGDPVLVLAAAKLRRRIDPAPVVRAPEGGSPGTEAPLDFDTMFAAAETLAAGDAALLGVIADARAETTKGVISGPVYNIAALRNGGADTYPRVDFAGGAYAEVYVEAKTQTDLNLTITDAQGRLVCSDTDISHIAYCGWRPAATGGFTIRVENNGPAGGDYALMTN